MTLKSVGKNWFTEDVQRKLDTRAYYTIISSKMRRQFIGYAAMLQDDRGTRLTFNRAGWAVSDVEADQRHEAHVFDLNTVAAWGSTGKIITTAAVLAAVQEQDKHLPEQLRLQALERPMKLLLPKRWAAELHSSFAPVTVRLLLEHKAGFQKSGEGKHIRERLRSGVEKAEGVNVRQYSNASMGMFHFILAKLVDPHGMQSVEDQLKNKSDDEYDRLIQQATSSCYNNWTHDKVFAPAGISAGTNPTLFRPNCALAYPQRGLSASQADRGSLMSDDTTHAASGGWLLSIKSMMQFLRALKYTDQVIGRQYYSLMENEQHPDRALGWWTTQQTKGGISFIHNGKRYAGQGSHNAQIINYPNGYQAAVIVNTELPADFSLLDVLVEAYNEALLPQPREKTSVSGAPLKPPVVQHT